MVDINITTVVTFILAYLIAYLLNKVEVWSIVILFFILYFIFTQVSFDVSSVGFDFTIDYYIQIGWAQTYNYVASLLGGGQTVLSYPKIETNFTHKYSGMNKQQSERKAHQFLASTPIDIFGNGIEYVYIGGGKGQQDVLLKPIYDDNDSNTLKLKKMSSHISNQVSDKASATYSAISFDITGNGVQDLIVARQNGITVYENRSSNKKVKFVKNIILEEYVFKNSSPIALCVGDVNLNGKPDILVSQFTYPSNLRAFQFHNSKHWAPNILLENVSSKNKVLFIDSTDKYGLAGNQNTFTSSFVALNNDFGEKYERTKPAQIINSNDTGKLEIYSPMKIKNDKEDRFKYSRLITEDQTFPNGFWMGLAIGDINNDGRLDMFSTNLGKDIPLPPQGTIGGTRGSKDTGLKPNQLLTHNNILLMNRTDDEVVKGAFKFQNVSAQSGVAIDGMGWGCVFEDFTLNGYLDLFYAQNYIDMSTLAQYNSAFYTIQNTDEIQKSKDAIPQFAKVDAVRNPNYAHTPMFCDFGKTGLKDLIWVNINGPLVAYQNSNVLKNNFISIRLPKNIRYLNASVVLKFKGDKSIAQRQNIVGGIGLTGDQSSTMVFGLGDRKLNAVESVKIYTMYSPFVTNITSKIKLNQRLVIK